MEYVFIIILIIIPAILFSKLKEKRDEQIMLGKLEDFKLNGFPKFSKKEQLEMIYSGEFQMINKRLDMKVVPTSCFKDIFSVTKPELHSYIINERDLLKNRDINLNLQDGTWLEKKESKFFVHERERGQILSSKTFEKRNDVIEYFTNRLYSIIPEENDNTMHTFIIKR